MFMWKQPPRFWEIEQIVVNQHKIEISDEP